MRINVYAEELTSTVQTTTKTSDNGNTFHAISFILDSPTSLHYRDNDDDRSAITFWVPGSSRKGVKTDLLINMFEQAIEHLKKL